jgi:hypothetical protein
LVGNHCCCCCCCCCVRVCQSPVLTGVLAGGVPCPTGTGGCCCRRWLRVKILHERVAGIDVHKDMTAPRGALLFSRFSREEFGGYSWV